MNMLIDTHAHLQMSDYNEDRDLVISRAVEAGVTCIVNASYDLASSWQAIKLSEEYSNLYASVGVHPHDAYTLDEETFNALWDISNHPKVIAIGETGLDYYRNRSPRDVQKKSFERHIELSLEFNLPIIVHNRNAHDDVLKILNEYKGKLRGVMHCFSGDLDFALRCIEIGFYISFAGNITYTNATTLREVASKVPDKKLMIETDCPFLTPQFKRGQRNEPSYIKGIAKKLAEIRQVALPDISQLTTKNAQELFGIQCQ